MAKLLIQLHLVAFRLISRTLTFAPSTCEPSPRRYVNHLPVVTRCLTKGFTLILSFAPQGRRDLTAFAGTTGTLLRPVCAGSRTWMPAFAGMTETGGRDGTGGTLILRLLPGGEGTCPPRREPSRAHFKLGTSVASMASFGPLSYPPIGKGTSGVAGSGETFNLVAFGCISSHFPNPHPLPFFL